MNELEQLQNTLPIIHKNKKYKDLAESIEHAVFEDRHYVSMKFDFEIDDKAMDALTSAHIEVTQATDGSFDYGFNF